MKTHPPLPRLAWTALLAVVFTALPLRAATLVLNPSADLYTASGSVSSLTSRLLVGAGSTPTTSADVSYLTFDLASLGLSASDIVSVTLGLYLVNPNSNTPGSIAATVMTASAAAAMSDTGGLSGAYAPALGTDVSAATAVSGSAASQYWTWDVTSLVTGADGVSNGVVGFALKATTASFVVRFTDRDPLNDPSPANGGFAPQLTIVTNAVPEPPSTALALMGAGLLAVAGLRRRLLA